MTMRPWEILQRAKFRKNLLKGIYSFGANLHQKLPILAICGAKSPHF